MIVAPTPGPAWALSLVHILDYEVFLVSRMKELHENGLDNENAVVGGVQQTGRIITAAALLMSIVFLSLLTSSVAFMKLFAVGLALAVLLDAFIVRGLLVPAIMKLAGNACWWAPPLSLIHIRCV